MLVMNSEDTIKRSINKKTSYFIYLETFIYCALTTSKIIFTEDLSVSSL